MRLSRGNVAFLVAVMLAGLVVLAVDAGRDRACERWQESYAEMDSGVTGTLDFVNEGPLADLRRRRPAGCAFPD